MVFSKCARGRLQTLVLRFWLLRRFLGVPSLSPYVDKSTEQTWESQIKPNIWLSSVSLGCLNSGWISQFICISQTPDFHQRVFNRKFLQNFQISESLAPTLRVSHASSSIKKEMFPSRRKALPSSWIALWKWNPFEDNVGKYSDWLSTAV